jgi:hypothetical protein
VCEIGDPFSVFYGGMSRPIRYVPETKTLLEATTRTLQGRLLLRPSAALNEIILGILGRAQQVYQVQICGFSFLSNHFHILLVVDHAKQLADFMGYINSNIAREAGRLNRWREKFWSRRYRAIVVSQEEGAQRERLKYVLAHGTKEGLVDHPREWPGVHAIRALVEDEPLEGYWFDRTQEYAARRRGKEHERLEFATHYSVTLSPLPCWAHLSPEQQRARVIDVVHEIEDEANRRREETGKTSPGPDAIRRQNPHEQPQRSKKSPAPLFHAVRLRVKKELYTAYAGFLAAFREAAEKWRSGDRTVVFPIGCYPPALPFVEG